MDPREKRIVLISYHYCAGGVHNPTGVLWLHQGSSSGCEHEPAVWVAARLREGSRQAGREGGGQAGGGSEEQQGLLGGQGRGQGRQVRQEDRPGPRSPRLPGQCHEAGLPDHPQEKV